MILKIIDKSTKETLFSGSVDLNVKNDNMKSYFTISGSSAEKIGIPCKITESTPVEYYINLLTKILMGKEVSVLLDNTLIYTLVVSQKSTIMILSGDDLKLMLSKI